MIGDIQDLHNVCMRSGPCLLTASEGRVWDGGVLMALFARHGCPTLSKEGQLERDQGTLETHEHADILPQNASA
jgi:hypothetical protein